MDNVHENSQSWAKIEPATSRYNCKVVGNPPSRTTKAKITHIK